MIVHEDIVKIPKGDVRKALEHGERHPESGHRSPMTGILRSAGRWLLDNTFGLEKDKTEPLMLRLQTTQVIGRMLYIPVPLVRDGKKVVVAIYVHMPKSRLATTQQVKGMTAAGWAKAGDLQLMHLPGQDMICVANQTVLSPMRALHGKEKEQNETKLP